ncbi:MAG: hypothetical protein P8I93_00440, partial [Crocinitomicaceae bacterium]|nr:hypothetical protein [Crocinitomicaceae bacterium]
LDDAIYTPGVTIDGSKNDFMMGFGLGAGMDYYILDNVYVGLELGLGFTWVDEGPTLGSATAASVTTDFMVSNPTTTSIGIGSGAIRLGWRF